MGAPSLDRDRGRDENYFKRLIVSEVEKKRRAMVSKYGLKPTKTSDRRPPDDDDDDEESEEEEDKDEDDEITQVSGVLTAIRSLISWVMAIFTQNNIKPSRYAVKPATEMLLPVH